MTGKYDHWPKNLIRPIKRKRKLKRDRIGDGNSKLTSESLIGSIPRLSGTYRCAFMYKPRLIEQEGFDFVPFYDESYLGLIPDFSLNTDNVVDPEYVDHKMFDVFEPDAGDEVYYLICPVSGLIKIGHTKSLLQRYAEHRTGAAIAPHFLASHMGNKAYEQYVHQIFEPLRHHGEWFWPHRALCDWVHNVSCIFGGNDRLIARLDAE